jgi:hypothetical protein
MPHEHRPFEAALPSDFDQWPAPVRVVWRELLGSSAWRSAGWAHVTLRQLGEAVARALNRPKCPHATVRRWLAWLTERGELARRCVRQGEALPDGSRAWCDHWIVLPGDAMKARAQSSPMIRGEIIFDLPPDHVARSAVRAPEAGFSRASVASASSLPLPPTGGEAPFKDSRLSSLSGSGSRSETLKLRTKPGESPNDAEGAALAPPVRMLAERILRHYATASGVRVTHFRASSRAVVAACLDEMEGSDAAKEMRLRAVIDDALRESQARGIAHPPLAYVFNGRHVRRRLERLAEAEHLALKATESADMFAEGFDRALGEARAEVRAGAPPVDALERVRPFVETGRVTDAKRLDALASLAEPGARTGQRLRKTAQDAPTRRRALEGADSLSTSSRGVYGPEEALRALTALLGEDGPPLPCPAPSTEILLTPEERAELEAAQELARARWARAG